MIKNKDWEWICGVTFEKSCVLCAKCMEKIAKLRNNPKINKDDPSLMGTIAGGVK